MDTADSMTNGGLLQEFHAMQRIGNRAVAEAQEENRRRGVPNVYSHRGRIYYELPNGELSLRDPWGEESNLDAADGASRGR
ncbi:MAG: hypothetical protein HY812_12885 [Planctomycetes bacterium]|nr:hypothetical protein [Planctomycetota bacterium]